MKKLIWILWPSFVVGAISNALFFTVFDPLELHTYWDTLPATRTAAYTVGFFFFWIVGACSSALTCFLQRTADEVNRRCPLEGHKRPVGCPKRT